MTRFIRSWSVLQDRKSSISSRSLSTSALSGTLNGLLVLSNGGADEKKFVRLHFLDAQENYGEADVLTSLPRGQQQNVYLSNLGKRIKLFRISWEDPCAGIRRKTGYSEEKTGGYNTISVNWFGIEGKEEDFLLMGDGQ